jgi:hypothetical protein
MVICKHFFLLFKGAQNSPTSKTNNAGQHQVAHFFINDFFLRFLHSRTFCIGDGTAGGGGGGGPKSM